MAQSVKVSTKYQISVPSDARKTLGIEAGDRLNVSVRGDELVLRRRPAKASERLRGLGKGLYGDSVEYLRQLHDEWENEAHEREQRWARELGPVGADTGATRTPSEGRTRRERPDRAAGG